MKKFENLHIGNIIYRCNFHTGDIEIYEIFNIEKSQYSEQICLSLKHKEHYTYVKEHINVYKKNSYEYVRNLIDYDDYIMWCTDKTAIKKMYKKYCDKIKHKLKENKKLIDNL